MGVSITAIETTFIAPTNTTHARIRVRALGTRQTLVLDWRDALGPTENHLAAAKALIVKMHWCGEWVVGNGKHGACIFVCRTPVVETIVLTDEEYLTRFAKYVRIDHNQVGNSSA